MKNAMVVVAVSLVLAAACKSKENVPQEQLSSTASVSGGTTGKVSHQYRASGCKTVIIVNGEAGTEPMILIPKDKLPAKLDVDGQEISFNYTPLKMPQPEGCAQGIPAEIKDAAAKAK